MCRHCYCYFRQKGHSQHKRLSKEQLALIVEEIKKNQIHHVTITGGEPLLELDNLLFFARELQQFPWLTVSLNTNLVLMTEEIAQQLLSVGISRILTSLMSDNPELNDYIACRNGTWEKTVNGIKIARQAGMHVMVNMVLTKWNIGRIYQTGKFVHSLGVTSFAASRACSPIPLMETFHKYLISAEEIRQSIDTLCKLRDELGMKIDTLTPYPWCIISDVAKYEFLTRRRCSAGITNAQIGPDGEVRPCPHSDRSYGSVFEEGLAGSFAKMKDWREQAYSGACKKCKFFKHCAGGCTIELSYGSYKAIGATLCEENVTRLPDRKPEQPRPTISPDDELSFVDTVVIREEEFGGSIFSRDSYEIHVDHDSFELSRKLKGRKFTAREVAEMSAFKLEKLLLTFSRWHRIKILQKGGDNDE